MRRFLHVPALSLLVFAALAPASQPAITRPDGSALTRAQIDSTVDRLIEAAHVTGAGLALFHNGEVVYLKAYGLRDVKENLPLTPDSVMSAASLTKAAFATLVMQLVQRGELDLDKPIEQYLGKPLGDFAPYSDLKGDPRTAKLTLRILLDHTSGFPNFRWIESDHKLHIHYDPGTHYGYSGEGVNLAQFVVEKVTGKSYKASFTAQSRQFGPESRILQRQNRSIRPRSASSLALQRMRHRVTFDTQESPCKYREPVVNSYLEFALWNPWQPSDRTDTEGGIQALQAAVLTATAKN